jgi:GxxExxY protein
MRASERILFRLSDQVIGAAISVHRGLGPGLLESTYEECLSYELVQAELKVERQVALPLSYKALTVSNAYRIDLVVNDALIVEVKSVESLSRLHTSQLLTYLKLTGLPAGLIINFNSALLRDGIKRYVNFLSVAVSARSACSVATPPAVVEGPMLPSAPGPALEESIEEIDSPQPRQ